jgi:zinc protease
MEGVPLDVLEAAAFEEIERVRTDGVNVAELARAKRQLRARLVFENDSVTNIAHQLGYFETIAGSEFLPTLQRRIDAVTPEQVWMVARRRLGQLTRTVGWFRPTEGR